MQLLISWFRVEVIAMAIEFDISGSQDSAKSNGSAAYKHTSYQCVDITNIWLK